MTAEISILLPTRGRPVLALRFLDSVLKRSERPERVEVVIYADEDDPQSHGLSSEGLEVRTIVGPRASMGSYNTACLEKSRGDIVMLANDDVIVRTDGWDERLRELDQRIEDKIYLAYPNDLFKGHRVCTFPVLSRRTCELLAEPFPAAYRGAFIDYHLLDIFRRLERSGFRRIHYLPDVVFEHMHPRAGKAAADRVYQERDRFGDDHMFLTLRDERSRSAARLAATAGNVAPRGVRRPDGAPPQPGILRATLLDPELPAAWRLRLFFWFLGRAVARRVL